MGFFGDLIAMPVRIVNAPLKAVEDVLADGKATDDERLISKPLDALGDQLSKVDGDKE